LAGSAAEKSVENEETGASQRRPTRTRRLFWSLLPAMPLGLCVFAVIVRLTIKDRVLGFDTLYYATPTAVLAGLAGVSGAWWLVLRRWKAAVPALVLGVACLVWWYQGSWYHNPPAAAGDGVRVLFWNVSSGALGWERMMREIRAYDPDVIAIVEGGRRLPDMRGFWAERWPGYSIASQGLGLILLVRGEQTVRGAGGLGVGRHRAYSWHVHSEVSVRGSRFHVVLVDITTYPHLSRKKALDPLYAYLDTLAGEPVLLIGDFNTPTDSVFFKPLRMRYSNAFEMTGRGYAPTWPNPLPVLTLDQAWNAGGLLVDRCELGWSWASDHRPMRLEVSLAR
jgi:endonuclease/exonuclease/phosphatase (EEP) superfamily protein YafD